VPAALTFVEDDYPRAIADGKAAHRLVFVDAWATWCHTCLSMKAFTFRDAKVRALANDFTWASIDTEKPENAAWVAAHPMHGWPTLYVVDPETDKTVLEWVNSATADELVALLGGAKMAAAKHAPMELPTRAAKLEMDLDALVRAKDSSGCAALGERELPNVAKGGGRAATLALRCAVDVPEASREPVLGDLIKRSRAIAADPEEPILADDRSDLYESIVDALKTEKRTDDARTVAMQWAAYLEGEASRAADPAARIVFDAHRLGAYLELGAPDKAIPMLEQSAKDFPNDYNPQARLARVYYELKRYEDALPAVRKALALVYGGRALRVLSLEADILEKKGDRAAAASELRAGVAKARATPLSASYAHLADALEKRAQALEAPPATH
jgi:tetratricopeptide (TPR) repeat protein